MNETYNIPFTNKSNSLVIEPYDVDKSTSLAFYGKNTLNYWLDMNKNMLLLLTNFSNPKPPITPITGQTWFDNSTNELKYYDDGWYRLKPATVDLSDCTYSRNDTMTGPLVLPSLPSTDTSVASRAYVESKVLGYTYGYTNNINWIRHANNYTVMNICVTKNKQTIIFPFSMVDTNYSILLTPNETTSGKYKPNHYTTYNKTVNGLTIDVNGTLSTMAIVIMGFAA